MELMRVWWLITGLQSLYSLATDFVVLLKKKGSIKFVHDHIDYKH